MTDKSAKQADAYDAFVSYSRKDKPFVESLVAALNSFKPPKLTGVAQRRLRVFRDEADLIGSDYYKSIGRNLGLARKLVLVCSPRSAQSDFVNDEIKRFLERSDPGNIIPILIDGKPNNEALPEEADERAFPPALCEALELPLAVNYVGFEPAKEKVNKGAWEPSWYAVVANILDVSRSELEERDRKRQLRRRNIVLSIASAVILALSALTVYAFRQRAVAVEQRVSAEARLLANQATQLLNRDESLLVRSMLLAVESLRMRPSDAAAGALRAGLGRLGRHQGSIEYEENEVGGGKSADGLYEMSYQVTAGEQYAQRAFSAAAGVEWEARITRSGEELVKLRSGAYRWRPWSCTNTPSELTITIGEETSSGTGMRYVRVRNDVTGDESLLIHDGAISACAVSSAGDLIVTASGDISRELPPVPIPGDQTLRIWKLPSPVLGLSEESSRTQLTATAFSPSARLLATAALRENWIRVFDLVEGTERARLRVRDRDVSNLAFSADGRYLASAPIYGEFFEVWSVDGLGKVATLAQYSSEGDVELSPDGSYLITDYGELTHPTGSEIWDLTSKKKISRFGSDPKSRDVMSFTPDGSRLFTIERIRLEEPPWQTGRFSVWDAASHEVITQIEGVEDHVLSGDGEALVLRMVSKSVYNEEEGTYSSEEGTGNIEIWSMNPPQRDQVIAAGATGSCLAVSPDGRYLAFCLNEKTVRVVDLGNGRQLHEFRHDDSVLAAAFSPDGRHLASATYAYGGQEANAFRLTNVLAIRDVESGEIVTSLRHRGLIDELVFSADGKYLASNTYQSEESGFAPAHVWMWRFDDLIREACRSLPRNMTLEEWNVYMTAGASYRKSCENLPEHRSARLSPEDPGT